MIPSQTREGPQSAIANVSAAAGKDLSHISARDVLGEILKTADNLGIWDDPVEIIYLGKQPAHPGIGILRINMMLADRIELCLPDFLNLGGPGDVTTGPVTSSLTR